MEWVEVEGQTIDEAVKMAMTELGIDNVMQIPKIEKIVLNMGVGDAVVVEDLFGELCALESFDRLPGGRIHDRGIIGPVMCGKKVFPGSIQAVVQAVDG